MKNIDTNQSFSVLRIVLMLCFVVFIFFIPIAKAGTVFVENHAPTSVVLILISSITGVQDNLPAGSKKTENIQDFSGNLSYAAITGTGASCQGLIALGQTLLIYANSTPIKPLVCQVK